MRISAQFTGHHINTSRHAGGILIPHNPRLAMEKSAIQEFRVAFDATPALISRPQQSEIQLMSDASSATPRPLGEISQEPAALDQFLERNQKKLLILVILVVIGAGAYIVQRGLKTSAETDAGGVLSQADDLPTLQKILKDYPNTAAAGSAKVLIADKQWTEGQQDAAIATLTGFIAANPEHPAVPTAQASLGSKLASQGKKDEAAAVLQKLADSESGRFLAPYALLSLGDLASASGDNTKAEAFYQKAQNEFPDSTFGNTAIKRLALLKAKAPAEIEPPPAPATPPGAVAPASGTIEGLPGISAPPAPGLPPVIEVPAAPAAPSVPAPTEPAPASSEPASKP